MTLLLRGLLYSLLITLLCACESEPVEKTVWDDQIQALDKAAAVEEDLMNRAENISNRLDLNNKDEDDPQR